MKIILNKCFGGFGLSHVAKINLLEAKGLKVYAYRVEEHYNSDPYSEYTLRKIDKFYKTERRFETFVYLKEPLAKDVTRISLHDYVEMLENGKYTFDEDKLRVDKDVIAIVEQLGSAASDNFSNLEIFEIPNGSEYIIDDYDGLEKAIFGKELGEV